MKSVYIEDSFTKMWRSEFLKTSKLISGRNPFRLDLDMIDYDMDSEEEFEEINGEDINTENS